jgi:hypothetical protein
MKTTPIDVVPSGIARYSQDNQERRINTRGVNVSLD